MSSASESAESAAAVQKTNTDAIEKGASHFSLADENGRTYLVPTATLAYVEVGSERHPPGGLRRLDAPCS